MTNITVKTLDQKTAQRIVDTTYELLKEHGLHGWKVRFGSATTRFGSCSYRTQTIRFSEVFAAKRSWEETYNTILHEVAHAIAGPHAKHGPAWKSVARSLGLKNPKSYTHSDVKIEKPWRGVCSAGHEVFRTRTPRNVGSCGTCKRSYDFAHVLTWSHHGQEVALSEMPVKYQVEYDVERSKYIRKQRAQHVSLAA